MPDPEEPKFGFHETRFNLRSQVGAVIRPSQAAAFDLGLVSEWGPAFRKGDAFTLMFGPIAEVGTSGFRTFRFGGGLFLFLGNDILGVDLAAGVTHERDFQTLVRTEGWVKLAPQFRVSVIFNNLSFAVGPYGRFSYGTHGPGGAVGLEIDLIALPLWLVYRNK